MKNKFTLLELLIVIAIIGILVTLLLPSLGKAREISKRAVCLSNLKQLYMGTVLYGKENNLNLPRAYKHGGKPNDYTDQLLTFLAAELYLDLRDNYMGGTDSIFDCVSLNTFKYDSTDDSYRMGYAYTGDKPSFNTNFNYEFPDKLTDNNEVVLWGEASYWSSLWSYTRVQHTAAGGLSAWPDGGMPGATFGAEGGNYMLLDGSGKWYASGALGTYEFFEHPAKVYGWLPKNMW